MSDIGPLFPRRSGARDPESWRGGVAHVHSAALMTCNRHVLEAVDVADVIVVFPGLLVDGHVLTIMLGAVLDCTRTLVTGTGEAADLVALHLKEPSPLSKLMWRVGSSAVFTPLGLGPSLSPRGPNFSMWTGADFARLPSVCLHPVLGDGPVPLVPTLRAAVIMSCDLGLMDRSR